MSKVVVVRDFMVTRLITLAPDMDIFAAIRLLLHHRISGAPVVDAERRLIGVLSEKDCLRLFASGAYYTGVAGKVEDYMTRDVVTATPEDELFQVADLLLERAFRRLPVVEGGKLVGQVSRRDVLVASLRMCEESPVKPPFTDARYLTDEIKAALEQPPTA